MNDENVSRGSWLQPARPVQKLERDGRIDLLRSAFILSLCGTHFTWFAVLVGYNFPIRFYDTQALGFTSPAEFFVFFSGYVMTLTTARTFRERGAQWSFLQCGVRSWQLFVLNLFTMTIILAISPFLFNGEEKLIGAARMSGLFDGGIEGLWRYITFYDEIGFFEILRNYIIFIPLTPLFIFLGRRYPEIPLVICVALWAVAQLSGERYFAVRSFDPISWQLIYFLGAYFAMRSPLSTWKSRNRAVELGVLGGLLLIAFAVKLYYSATYGFGFDVPFTGKLEVQPLRLLHFLVLLRFLMLALPSSEWISNWLPFKAIKVVGQNSLEAFCLANVLVYLTTQLYIMSGKSVPSYFILLILMFAMITLGAQLFGWVKKEPWRVQKPTKPGPAT